MPKALGPMKWNALPVATLPGVPLGYEMEDGDGRTFRMVKFAATCAAGALVTHTNTANIVTGTIANGGANMSAGIATVIVGTADYYGWVQTKGLNKTAMLNSSTDTIDENEFIFPDGNGTVTSADAAAEYYPKCGVYIASAQIATSAAIPVGTVMLNCVA